MSTVHTIVHKCDDCGCVVVAERTISQDASDRLLGQADRDPESVTVQFKSEGNRFIKWSFCQMCYQWEMARP